MRHYHTSRPTDPANQACPLRIGLLAALSLCAVQTTSANVFAAPETRVCVSDFGANAKPDQNDTVAFQKAIDACCAKGGGTVVVPPGTYRIGRVILKDNVNVNLEAGAIVHPSTNRADYPAITGAVDSNYQPKQLENALNCRFAMFYAYRAKNVAVFGRGKLLGDGKSFWKVKATGTFSEWNTVAPQFYYTPNAFRPIPILFEDCEKIAVRDITIEDSPCYASWFAGCRYVNIADICICNDLTGPNTDGLHFSSCRNVHVTDCDFVCGDDCIAIDPNHRGPSQNYTISGCTFKTTVNVFRIYTGLDPGLSPKMPRGLVSDISASNCSVEDASGVFNVTAERGDIQRLTFSNFAINMERRGSAFFFLTMAGGGIQGLTLSNMAIRTDGAGFMSGEQSGKISDIVLDAIQYDLYPRTKVFGNGIPDPTPGYCVHHFAPYNLCIRHAENIKLHNIQVNWRKAELADIEKTPGWKRTWSCIECRDVLGLDIDGVTCSPFGIDSPAILVDTVRRAVLSNCRSQSSTKVFVQVQGRSKDISLIGNDLSQAEMPYRVTGDSTPATVFEASNRTRPAQ